MMVTEIILYRSSDGKQGKSKCNIMHTKRCYTETEEDIGSDES
jgi:hypothetical protein